MGIYDRDYVRTDRGGGGGGFRPGSIGRLRGWSVNTWLIAINVVIFVIQGVLLVNAGSPVLVDEELYKQPPSGQLAESQAFIRPGGGLASPAEQRRAGNALTRALVDAPSGAPVGKRIYQVMDPIEKWGHFSTLRGFRMMEVWRLVTFQFLHAGVMHIFFNMLGLFFFGSLVEQYLGKKRYAAYYLMCGVSGGVSYLILNLIGFLGLPLPGALDVSVGTPLIGASAGVFGVIVACAYIAPNTVVQLLFPPIPLKMRTFAYGYVGLVVLNLFFFRGHNVGGDAAHLGGALAGYYFIRRPHLLRDFFDVFGNSNKPRIRPGPRVGKRKSASEREIDAILAKVQRDGLHSLSESEKRVLSQATAERRG